MDTIPRDPYEFHHDSTIMPHARANQELAQPSRLRERGSPEPLPPRRAEEGATSLVVTVVGMNEPSIPQGTAASGRHVNDRRIRLVHKVQTQDSKPRQAHPPGSASPLPVALNRTRDYHRKNVAWELSYPYSTNCAFSLQSQAAQCDDQMEVALRHLQTGVNRPLRRSLRRDIKPSSQMASFSTCLPAHTMLGLDLTQIHGLRP